MRFIKNYQTKPSRHTLQ